MKGHKGEIILFSFCGTETTEKGISDYANCGFDVMPIDPIYKYGSAEYLHIFEICEKYGIKGMPVCVGWCDGENGYVAFPREYDKTEYGKMDSFYGAYLWDEPNSDNWRELLNNIKVFESKFPNKNVLINISACYGDKRLIDKYPLDKAGYGHDLVRATGKQFTEDVLDEIKGEKILSFDYYPLMEDGTLIHDYLWPFDTYSAWARDKGYRLCAIVQTTGIESCEFGSNRELHNSKDYRFQCLVAMAYGCSMIGAFTYKSPFAPKRLGLVYESKRLPAYYYVKKVNKEIKKFSCEYMKYNWQKAGLVLSKEPFKHSITALKRMINNDTEFKVIRVLKVYVDTLIGEFKAKNGDGYGYMILNYQEPQDKKKNYVELAVENGIKEITEIRNGVVKKKEVKDGNIRISLSAGNGVFIEIKK